MHAYHRICLYQLVALRKWHLRDISINLILCKPSNVSTSSQILYYTLASVDLVDNLMQFISVVTGALIYFMFQTNLKGYLYNTVCILKPGKLKHFLWKGKRDLDACIWFQAYNCRELLSLGFDTIASAYLRGDIAVNPSNLFVLDCEAMPVAMDFFYTFGSPCFFHSLMELGINGGKYMPNL